MQSTASYSIYMLKRNLNTIIQPIYEIKVCVFTGELLGIVIHIRVLILNEYVPIYKVVQI